MNNQTQQTVSPAVQQVTQGIANPAQNVQTQQVVDNKVTSNVSGMAVQSASNPNNVQGASNHNNVQGSFNTQGNVQYGATNIQSAGNPANVNNIDSQVDAFLKAHNLRK